MNNVQATDKNNILLMKVNGAEKSIELRHKINTQYELSKIFGPKSYFIAMYAVKNTALRERRVPDENYNTKSLIKRFRCSRNTVKLVTQAINTAPYIDAKDFDTDGAFFDIKYPDYDKHSEYPSYDTLSNTLTYFTAVKDIINAVTKFFSKKLVRWPIGYSVYHYLYLRASNNSNDLIKCTQADIAERFHVSRPTIANALRKLKAHHLVTYQSGYIRVTDNKERKVLKESNQRIKDNLKLEEQLNLERNGYRKRVIDSCRKHTLPFSEYMFYTKIIETYDEYIESIVMKAFRLK